MGKTRHRGVKLHAQGHTDSRYPSNGYNKADTVKALEKYYHSYYLNLTFPIPVQRAEGGQAWRDQEIAVCV
jgi:hypothetical protein